MNNDEHFDAYSRDRVNDRIARLRREALEEFRLEHPELLDIEDDGFAAKLLARSAVPVKVERARSLVMPRVTLRPYEVVDSEGAVVAEHASRGEADSDAAARTLEFEGTGITFRARKKKSSGDTHSKER